MAIANYKLIIGALIDTIFVFEIGGKNVDVEELEGTLEDVHIENNGIHIRLELGGSENAPWNLEVSVEDDGTEYKTVPERIKGKIGREGGSWFDRTCALKEV